MGSRSRSLSALFKSFPKCTQASSPINRTLRTFKSPIPFPKWPHIPIAPNPFPNCLSPLPPPAQAQVTGPTSNMPLDFAFKALESSLSPESTRTSASHAWSSASTSNQSDWPVSRCWFRRWKLCATKTSMPMQIGVRRYIKEFFRRRKKCPVQGLPKLFQCRKSRWMSLRRWCFCSREAWQCLRRAHKGSTWGRGQDHVASRIDRESCGGRCLFGECGWELWAKAYWNGDGRATDSYTSVCSGEGCHGFRHGAALCWYYPDLSESCYCM